MKVCHVITRMIVGGAQENTLFSAAGLVEAGHECTLMTGPSPGPEGELLANGGTPDGIKVETCPYLVREISPVNDLKAYFHLRNYFREHDFDVVHTHSSKAGIIGRLAARAAGVPVVVHTIHGLPFHPREKWWKNRLYVALESCAARHCDRIFAVAQAMVDQALAQNIGRPDMYQVVYSGMNLTHFLTAERDPGLRAALGIPEHAKVLGTVARLFPLKGYEELMKIAPDLLRAEKDLYFLFVGDGELHETLKKQAEDGGFADRIVFAGLVAPSEVGKYIAQMDVLAHFSLREGLPRAAVQALACGKPVVAYPLDGTPEVVLDGKTGILCPTGDTAAMTEAISGLLADGALRERMGRAGRELVRGKFAWRDMSDTLIAAYEKLLNDKALKRV